MNFLTVFLKHFQAILAISHDFLRIRKKLILQNFSKNDIFQVVFCMTTLVTTTATFHILMYGMSSVQDSSQDF